MKIYLVQHGKPVSKEENPNKPLSIQGKEDVKRMTDFLFEAGVQVEEIFQSGKTRARQTADILASKLIPGREVLERKGLAPLDDAKVTAEEIVQIQKDIMIVGHLPHLSRLSSFLITGTDSSEVVRFQQGGVVCLNQNDDKEKAWAIDWMVVPELFR
jgi:phosphohistidine phosphatase